MAKIDIFWTTIKRHSSFRESNGQMYYDAFRFLMHFKFTLTMLISEHIQIPKISMNRYPNIVEEYQCQTILESECICIGKTQRNTCGYIFEYLYLEILKSIFSSRAGHTSSVTDQVLKSSSFAGTVGVICDFNRIGAQSC